MDSVRKGAESKKYYHEGTFNGARCASEVIVLDGREVTLRYNSHFGTYESHAYVRDKERVL